MPAHPFFSRCLEARRLPANIASIFEPAQSTAGLAVHKNRISYEGPMKDAWTIVDTIRKTRWSLLILALIAVVEALMLKDDFPARDSMLQETLFFWTFTALAIAVSLLLLRAKRTIKKKWLEITCHAISRVILTGLILAHLAWMLVMTGGG